MDITTISTDEYENSVVINKTKRFDFAMGSRDDYEVLHVDVPFAQITLENSLWPVCYFTRKELETRIMEQLPHLQSIDGEEWKAIRKLILAEMKVCNIEAR